MSGINLLPQELKPKSYAVVFAKKLKRVANFLSIIFFISLAITAIFYTASLIQMKNLTDKHKNLSSELQVLETSEQKLVLVRDRLEKIGKVYASGKTSQNLPVLEEINSNIPEGINLISIKVDSETVDVAFIAESNDSLKKYLELLYNMDFLIINLESFAYTSQNGYKVVVSIVK